MTDWGARPPYRDAPPPFPVGSRVVWLHNGKRYPATVRAAGWYRRTAEPWQFAIELDRNYLTRLMTWLDRYVPASSLEKLSAEGIAPTAAGVKLGS